jgi:hypothetical protein
VDKICIVVCYSSEENIIDKLYESKQIQCPEPGCGKFLIFNIVDFSKITFKECEEGHKKNDILLKDYENNKYVDDSNITCSICKKQKMDSYKHLFYRCISCGINLCPLCKPKHIKDSECNKNIIYYDEINYYCKEHENERINSYCFDCKKNYCGGLCQKKHKSHNKLNLGEITPEIEICKDNIKEIDKFNANIENIKHILEKVKDNMESILKIYKDIIDNFSERERTYETYSKLSFIEDIDKN